MVSLRISYPAGQKLYHFLCLCVHYAFFLYQERPLCWDTLVCVSSSSPVGKACLSLLTSTCVLCIPSLSERPTHVHVCIIPLFCGRAAILYHYSRPCVYIPSHMEGPQSCVITYVHVCISPLVWKGPNPVSYYLHPCVYIPSRMEGSLSMCVLGISSLRAQ